MKTIKCLRNTMLVGMLVFAGNALAYGDDSDKKCKKPKFRTFEPAHLSEVAPETEISFHVSNWADPASITAEAKKVPMKVEVEDKMNYFIGTAKLPASLSGTYARIHITAKADDGGCLGQDGWLLKIKKAAPAAAAETPAEPANSEDKDTAGAEQ